MRNRVATLLALAGLGGFSIPAQILLVREFLSLFNGNELALGTVLGMWMLLTGAGVWLARTFPVKKGVWAFTFFLLTLLSVIPILTIFKLGLFRATAFPYGAMTGLWEIAYTSFLALAPFCLMNGYLFITLTSLLRSQGDPEAPGRAYSIESLGGLAGGALVNFVLLWHFSCFVSLRITFLLFLVVHLVCAFLRLRLPGALLLLFIGAGLTAGVFLFPFEKETYRAVYKEQEVVLDKETPYGKITITRSGTQQNYYADGALLFSSGNTIWNEESAHYALLQRPSPRAVLLIGGDLSGDLPEILKYRPGRLDYVEINPVLADLARQQIRKMNLDNVRVHQGDVRPFLMLAGDPYDIILVNVPEPSSIQLNRYYSSEFASILKNRLSPGGVVSLSLPATTDYVSPEAGRMNAILYGTLKTAFSQVVIVPGNRNWFLASDSSLSIEIARLYDQRLIENLFVNSFYIDDGMLADRSAFIMKNLPANAPVNHDYHPVLYRQVLSLWLHRSGIGWPWVLGAIAMVFVLVLLLLNRSGAGMFAAGFAGVSVEIIVMLAFQVALGYVFTMAGIVIMLFMAGLAAGPWVARRFFPAPREMHFLLLLGLMSLMPLFVFLVILLCKLPAVLGALLIILTLITSILLGMLYPISVAGSSGGIIRSASRNYAADLFGSALGAFLVPMVFLPVIGIELTLVLLTLLTLLAAAIFYLSGKRT